MKRILSGIISAALTIALSGAVVSAETAEPNFPMNGNKCGKVIVSADIERDVEVTITQNTQDGNFDYYTTVIPQGNTETYEFVLEGKDDVNYTIKIGVSKFKKSDNLQFFSEEFMVYDTDEIAEQNVSGYEYSYTVHEGEELTNTAAAENEKDENGVVKNKKDLYFPVSNGIKGDVNMNGDVDLHDVIMVAKYLVNTITFNSDEFELADFNSNSKVDLQDAIGMAKYILKK